MTLEGLLVGAVWETGGPLADVDLIRVLASFPVDFGVPNEMDMVSEMMSRE